MDYPKLTYIVSPICKSRFKDLNFFIPSKSVVDKIPKIMIFVNEINNNLKIAKYLCPRLLEHILERRASKLYYYIKEQILRRLSL